MWAGEAALPDTAEHGRHAEGGAHRCTWQHAVSCVGEIDRGRMRETSVVVNTDASKP